jgi:hypothetical protein
VKHFLMTTLYPHERYSHEEVEEVTEEMKPSLFSADASRSQHKGLCYRGVDDPLCFIPCIGYLVHPFENLPFEKDNSLLHHLQTKVGEDKIGSRQHFLML